MPTTSSNRSSRRDRTTDHAARALFAARLRRDHANISRILGVITAVLYAVRERPAETLPVLRDAFRYLTLFQDAYHHPAEDLLYGRVLKHQPQYERRVRRLHHDHTLVERAGAAVAAALERAGIDASTEQLDLLTQRLEDYAERMRRHMAYEERMVWDKLDAILDAADWHELKRISPPADPLACTQAEMVREYPALLRSLHTTCRTITTRPQVLGELLLPALSPQLQAASGLLEKHARQAGRLASACWSLARPRPPGEWWAQTLGTAQSTLRLMRSYWNDWQTLLQRDGPGASTGSAARPSSMAPALSGNVRASASGMPARRRSGAPPRAGHVEAQLPNVWRRSTRRSRNSGVRSPSSPALVPDAHPRPNGRL